MDIELEIARYRSRRLDFENYGKKLNALLHELLASRGIKSYIESRAKTEKSFGEKITRPGKQYTYPLREMTDLAAVRVICSDKNMVDLVCEIIREHLDVDETNSVDKRRTIDADRFGYASVHLIVRPTPSRGLLPEWQKYCHFPAEIQVRTFLAHAWAMLSHTAQYKRETEAPLPLVRRLARLAALLELADEEVASVKRTQEAVTAQAAKRASAHDFDMTPDVVTLKAYLRNAPVVRQLAEMAGQVEAGNTLHALAELFHLGAGMRIETLQHLDDELKAAASDEERLRRFFADTRVRVFRK